MSAISLLAVSAQKSCTTRRSVPLILHLEGVALHPAFGPQAGGDLVVQRADVEDGLRRTDEVGKARNFLAVDVDHLDRGSIR